MFHGLNIEYVVVLNNIIARVYLCVNLRISTSIIRQSDMYKMHEGYRVVLPSLDFLPSYADIKYMRFVLLRVYRCFIKPNSHFYKGPDRNGFTLFLSGLRQTSKA